MIKLNALKAEAIRINRKAEKGKRRFFTRKSLSTMFPSRFSPEIGTIASIPQINRVITNPPIIVNTPNKIGSGMKVTDTESTRTKRDLRNPENKQTPKNVNLRPLNRMIFIIFARSIVLIDSFIQEWLIHYQPQD